MKNFLLKLFVTQMSLGYHLVRGYDEILLGLTIRFNHVTYHNRSDVNCEISIGFLCWTLFLYVGFFWPSGKADTEYNQ